MIGHEINLIHIHIGGQKPEVHTKRACPTRLGIHAGAGILADQIREFRQLAGFLRIKENINGFLDVEGGRVADIVHVGLEIFWRFQPLGKTFVFFEMEKADIVSKVVHKWRTYHHFRRLAGFWILEEEERNFILKSRPKVLVVNDKFFKIFIKEVNAFGDMRVVGCELIFLVTFWKLRDFRIDQGQFSLVAFRIEFYPRGDFRTIDDGGNTALCKRLAGGDCPVGADLEIVFFEISTEKLFKFRHESLGESRDAVFILAHAIEPEGISE